MTLVRPVAVDHFANVVGFNPSGTARQFTRDAAHWCCAAGQWCEEVLQEVQGVVGEAGADPTGERQLPVGAGDGYGQ